MSETVLKEVILFFTQAKVAVPRSRRNTLLKSKSPAFTVSFMYKRAVKLIKYKEKICRITPLRIIRILN